MVVKLSPEALAFFRKQGARGGRIGAKARMEKLTPEERSEAARNGGKSRWKARNGDGDGDGTSTALSDSGTPAENVQPIKKKAKK